MLLLATVLPAVNFDLTDWKLQLPTPQVGEDRGGHVEVVDLSDFTCEHFFTGSDGAMVLRAPVDGATTRNSRYARSELREMSEGENAAWSLEEGGYMAVALRVDEVPHRLDGGETRVVIGQVHAGDSQLIRLYYGAGGLTLVNGRNEARAQDLFLNLLDDHGNRPHIDLGEPFAYSFEVSAAEAEVTVQADGTTYRSSFPIGDGWQDNGFYFKAGLYLSADETTATGWGQVSIYGLAVTHDGTRPALEVPSLTTAALANEGDHDLRDLEDIQNVQPTGALVEPQPRLAGFGMTGAMAGLGAVLAGASVVTLAVRRRRPPGA